MRRPLSNVGQAILSPVWVAQASACGGGASRLLLFLCLILAPQSNAQNRPIDPRAEPLATEWKNATTEAENSHLLEKYAPIDEALLNGLSDAGQILKKTGDLPAARLRFEICLEAALRANNDEFTAVGLQLEGEVDRLEGKYEDAENHYRRGLTYAEKPGATDRTPFLLNDLAGIYGSLARYPEAIEMLQASIDFADRHGVKPEPSIFQNLGIIYALTGDMNRSLQYFLKAQGLYDERKDDRRLALVHSNIGVLYSRQGNFASASREFETGVALAEKTGDNVQLAHVLGDLGRMRGIENKPTEATAIFTRALDLTRETGVRGAHTQTLLNMAGFETDRRDFVHAKAHFEQALQVAQEMKNGDDQGQAIRGLGLIARQQKDFQAALNYAQQGLALAIPAGDRISQWQSEALAGIAWRGMGDSNNARRAFERAIGLIEKQRGLVAGGEIEKQLFFEQAVFPYQELALLEAESGNALSALQAAERTRARVLLDIVEAGPNPIDRLMSGDERTEEKRLRAAIAAANMHPTANRQRDDAWQAYESFLSALYTRKPELRTWRGDSLVITEQDLETLVPDSKTALVEFLSGEDQTLLFTVTRNAVGKVQIKTQRLQIGRTTLAKRAADFRSQLEGRDPGFRASSTALYNELLKPAAAELRNRTRVYIVADGPLWELPFQALPGPAGGYWIEHAAISMTPSIGFLRDQTALKKNSAPAFTHDLVAFSGLADLDEQVRRVGALYDPGRALVRPSAQARETAFAAEAPDAKILHVAAHGLVDRQNSMHSHIILAPPDGKAQEDGWLEAWELMRMSLNADLAILSACETGRGRVAEGEGIVGLTWALFVAGVKTTVVSQWQVESRSTTELMVKLHQRLRQNQKPAEALRGAVLELMKDPRYSHPMYWSAFVVAGL